MCVCSKKLKLAKQQIASSAQRTTLQKKLSKITPKVIIRKSLVPELSDKTAVPKSTTESSVPGVAMSSSSQLTESEPALSMLGSNNSPSNASLATTGTDLLMTPDR